MSDRIYTQPDHVRITERWVSLGEVDEDLTVEYSPTDRVFSEEEDP